MAPGQVFRDVDTKELGAIHSLHCGTVDGQCSMLGVLLKSTTISFIFFHIQVEIVFAPHGKPAHLTPVDRLIFVVDDQFKYFCRGGNCSCSKCISGGQKQGYKWIIKKNIQTCFWLHCFKTDCFKTS